MKLDDALVEPGLRCARGIADFLCTNQIRPGRPGAGAFPGYIGPDGASTVAGNWMQAFGCMGLLAAARAFDEPAYERAALRIGGWLKTLQIFDPFHKAHYGAIREDTPQTPASHPRDALSAAWAFIELYRHTGDNEYLERARLFGDWFLNAALDDEGWPLWTVVFDDNDGGFEAHNDIQGSFHGGSLNLFYQLAKATGEPRWTGDAYVRMADHLVTHIQQPSGVFLSVERATHKPPAADPQNALHRANDDLATLGLLGAWKQTGEQRYLDAVGRFLEYVYSQPSEDGGFEPSVAAIPIVLNITREAGDALDIGSRRDQAVAAALRRLYAAQSEGETYGIMRGGLIEVAGQAYTTGRSTCYALIVLLKLFAGVEDYLTA